MDYGVVATAESRWYTTFRRAGTTGAAAQDERSAADMCLAIPGQVIELVDEVNQIAKVDVVGVRRNINVSLLASDGDEVRPGDWVLIHVGFALSKVDEEEAHATLALLQGMGRDYEQELEELKASVIE
jgi:hydrogenase expression/formation protein HypC